MVIYRNKLPVSFSTVFERESESDMTLIVESSCIQETRFGRIRDFIFLPGFLEAMSGIPQEHHLHRPKLILPHEPHLRCLMLGHGFRIVSEMQEDSLDSDSKWHLMGLSGNFSNICLIKFMVEWQRQFLAAGDPSPRD